MTGPVTATKVPLSCRHEVVAKSPLTGIYGESDSGGTWGNELKKAEYDGIIVRGQSSKPVYLWSCDGQAELRNAEHLWGIDTYDVDEIIKHEMDRKPVVSCIRPAGEKVARIAGIMNDGYGPWRVYGDRANAYVTLRGCTTPVRGSAEKTTRYRLGY